MKCLKKYSHILVPVITLILLIALWHIITVLELMDSFILPSPIKVITALFTEFSTMTPHILITLKQSLIGLSCAIILAFVLAILMDRFSLMYQAIYPMLLLSQTIPVVVLAPIFVLWFGFGLMPKILVIVSCCYFPITLSLIGAFKSVDNEMANLMRSMNTSTYQKFRYFKIPAALPSLFTGLKMSATYSVMGSVVAEWLGGSNGLGVYMMRVRNSYAIDKMFAAILIVIGMSLAIFLVVVALEKILMPYKSKYQGEK